MVNLHIEIDGHRSLSVESWSVLPDDRQQTVEVVGGTVVGAAVVGGTVVAGGLVDFV